MFNKKNHIKNIKTVLLIMLLWFIAVMLYFNVIIQTLSIFSSNSIDSGEHYLIAVMIALFLGFLGAVIEVYFQIKQFRKSPFIIVVLGKTFLLILAFILTVFFVTLIDPQNHIDATTGSGILGRIKHFSEIIFNQEFYNHLFYTIVIGLSINFFVQINKKMGRGVLLNLFLGKYHKPRKEERIFAFLDLTSSTLIAERLSPELYSTFIKDFFYDIDGAIENTKGEIFQYVGDEVVIIWDKLDGIENNNCLHFFFLAEEQIRANKEYYYRKYNVIPEFKAGIHFGEVVVTEVGGVKREIAYHGDTINTTSRIRSACTDLKERLLISADLLSLLRHVDSGFFVESKGVTSLKGKSNVLGIFGIKEKQPKNTDTNSKNLTG